MNNFVTNQYHLYDYNQTLLSLVVYNPTLANKVNTKLGDYYKDIRIVKGEEPVFKITRKQFDDIKTMVAFKHIILK